ncbi:MAG: Dna2/Cas4 domain-containing protein [Candidatus Pacebacteria bacterium]|nr:Dna2/Cas4 domain-containing protein [Candidatus Paceibacterota bacterium]
MLKELIDKFYLEQEKSKHQFHFYITDAGKCQRAVFFKFKNVPGTKTDPRLLRMFEHGELLHRNIFNVLYRLKIGVTTEVKIPEQAIISGRADAILSLNGENYVLDIKSINSMAFRKLVSPKDENICQIQLYLHYFKIQKGILLYIDKDLQEMKEFLVNYDPALVNQLLIGFDQLKDKIEKNILPVALFDYPKNWQCVYCQYRQLCDMVGKQEISWNEFKTRIQSGNDHETF